VHNITVFINLAQFGMGNGFFHIFFAGLFLLLFVAGAIMFYQMERETEDQRSINNYMYTRGAAPMPPSWRSKLGKGI
jgi:hypothetical protein